MGILDRVMDMQRQGFPDAEIATRLQNEGVSPREIYDSLNQAKIKNAVSPPDALPVPSPQGLSSDMQPSIMPYQGDPNQALMNNQQVQSSPMTQSPVPEMYPPEANYASQSSLPEYYPAMPQAYADQGQGYYGQQQSGLVDTETISEVAEQVASEKISEFKKSVGDLNLFRSVVQDKLSELDDRLRRIESSLDKMTHAVIGRVGEFGDTSAMIHKDLENLHGTVAKLMNPLVDNYNELKRLTSKE